MSSFRVEKTASHLAIVTFDLEGEKINKISTDIGKELEVLLEGLKKDRSIQGMILVSGKKDIFIAGADIYEILSVTSSQEGTEKSREAQRLPALIESLPFPSVAAIHGACLGGGLELVLGFSYVIATDDPKTKIGLPEVSLGILPGMGGCVRLPKRVGLQNALDMILGAKVWPAKKCFKTKLIDEWVPKEILLERSLEVLEEGIWKKRKREKVSIQSLLLEKNRFGRSLIYKKAKEQVLDKTKGHYPAPLRALEVIYETLDRGMTDALAIEAEAFGELVSTSICKNLMGVFFLQEAAKKKTGSNTPDILPKVIEHAGVVGAGAMGGGIAQLLSHRGIPVRLKDIETKALSRGLSTAKKLFDDLVLKKKLTTREAYQKMIQISPTTQYSGFKHLDLVIEAVIEDLSVKQKVFLDLQASTSPETILATNTSSLSVKDIGSACAHPERIIGLHFFNPVHKMPLVEVIRVKEVTSEETVVTAVQFVKQIGKVPIVVKDVSGFLVNRILMPYMNEACYLLEEGISISMIDQTVEAFGLPMGPFALTDAVGIDIAQKASHVMYQAYGERLKPHDFLDKVVQAGFLGNKNNQGFYKKDKKEKHENATIYSIIDVKPREQAYVSQDWIERMIFLMINEAALCLEEGVVEQPQDVDVGMVFGMGFPPFRGGLMKYADSVGVDKIFSELEILERRYGLRFKPALLIERLARSGGTFYEH
ncbi:MAG: enoyl-CoA hydratase/isomerase family protein [Deltaproteobacteria bacterium]|nr:enoyl-CoA hydratase/isomerase family protein [Deltaproteobacteria bacterium]